MVLLTAACAAVLLTTLTSATSSLHPLSDEFIAHINSKQDTWKAGRNFPLNTPLAHIKKLMGVLKDDHFLSLPVKVHDADLIARLPENFDPRDKWPNCPTLNEIRDQGSCGSCWAFGAVEAMTDRVCTYSNGTKHFHFSAEDLVSCCSWCGCGCNGGMSSSAWQYWSDFGLVSGGSYNSAQGCKPYEIPPCQHYTSGNREPCNGTLPTPECETECESGYYLDYKNDKHYGKHIFRLLNDEYHVKAELFMNGPVETSFTVYADFLQYKNGTYEHTAGKFVGRHAVKILGWGVEDGKKYWLIANSWNSDCGDNGFFKFLRGKNHCDIESEIIGGEPNLDDL